MSHLLQMRGLKPNASSFFSVDSGSHLLQMRGLKHLSANEYRRNQLSHLLQMRGLKPKVCSCPHQP